MRFSNLLGSTAPVFAPEGGGMAAAAGAAAAGDGGGGGGGAGGGAAAAAGGTAAAAGDGAWAPPKDLPEAYRGKTADETLGKLFPAFTEANTRAEGLRSKLAGMPKAPDTPEAYTFKPGEKVAPYFPGGDKNPAIAAARTAAHKAGIPDSQFQPFIEGVYGPMIEAGLIPPPFDAGREIKSFSSALGLDQKGAATALNDTLAFAKGIVPQLRDVPDALKKDVEATLLSLTDTAAGNVLLRALAGRLGENGIRVAGGAAGQGGALSEVELKTLGADPRIEPRNRGHVDVNKRFDPALRQRYDDGHQALAAAKKAK